MKKILSILLLIVVAYVLVTFFGVVPNIESMTVAIVGLIGSASLACQTLAAVAKVTPTTRDDKFVTGIKMYLAYLSELLDLLAFNLPKEKAKSAKKAHEKGVIDD